jgi:hypothetical protein
VPSVVSASVRYGLTHVCLKCHSRPTRNCSACCDFWSEIKFSVLASSGFRWPPSRSSILVRSWFSILAWLPVPQLAPRSPKAPTDFSAREQCQGRFYLGVESSVPRFHLLHCQCDRTTSEMRGRSFRIRIR